MVMVVLFFNDTAATEIYTLSLHDALPISVGEPEPRRGLHGVRVRVLRERRADGDPAGDERRLRVLLSGGDRKSTRLNSSHANTLYAVFRLKKTPSSPIPPQPPPATLLPPS